MQTVRQIERLFTGHQFERLIQHLLAARPEASLRLELELAKPLPSAALAMIRLEELQQAQHPLCQRLVRYVLGSQEADGGWGDPLVTALCIRGLLTSQGRGIAIDRGISHLADLQKPDGLWPTLPVRRATADPYTSAFILFQLADQPAFRSAVRLDDAINWFCTNQATLDVETERLWKRAAIRCRLAPRRSCTPAN